MLKVKLLAQRHAEHQPALSSVWDRLLRSAASHTERTVQSSMVGLLFINKFYSEEFPYLFFRKIPLCSHLAG
jgi:hypothetical protein